MGGSSSHVAKTAPKWDAGDYVSFDDSEPKSLMYAHEVAKIRFSASGIAAPADKGGAPEHTVMEALKLAATNWGDAPAMRVERPLPPLEGKAAPASLPVAEWKTWTYGQYYADSRSAAKGFMALGAVRYDGIMILGFNSPEWFMAEMGAMFLGGKAAGVYPTDTPAQVQFKTELADGAVAVVDNEASLARYAAVIDELPYLKAIVTWLHPDGKDLTRTDGSVVKVLTWDQLVALGEGGGEAADTALTAVTDATEPGNCACLVFTSGTTGHPKAVMVSHDNLLFEAYNVVKLGIPTLGEEAEEERVISYLPLSHVAGMMVDIISPVVTTAYRNGYVAVHFARPYDLKVGTLGDRLRAVRPTMFLGVPRVWQKIAEKMKAVGASTKGAKKAIASWAKSYASYHQSNMLLGGSGAKGLAYPVANVLLSKIKAALGLDACKFMFSGAAPLDMETLQYFASIGININEVYGMSECTGATTWSTDACHLWTSIGYEMRGMEVKVFVVGEDGSKTEAKAAEDFYKPAEEEQGEVCFRGRHVMMGYLCNPKLGEEHVAEMTKKNAETIDAEGWLHSGDKGSKDVQGMFRITGRYKELIITAGGENIAPVPIEDAIKKACPVVSNVMLVGDKRKFNVCLVTLKAVGATGELPGSDVLEGAAAALVGDVDTIPQAMKSDAFVKAITDAITAVNNDGEVCPSNASKVQKFTILPTDLSVETGEITPSLKLKRSVVTAKYDATIEAVYASNAVYTPYTA